MKNIFSLCLMITGLLACNSNNDTTVTKDSSNQASQHQEHTNADDSSKSNAITAAMDQMMQAMHSAATTGNNDADFASMMIEHHKGAVEMSKLQTTHGENADLKSFANKVIDDQSQEIAGMEAFLAKSTKTASANSEAFQKALHGSMAAMMNANTPRYNNIDKDYAAQMIPHHQSAVDMAKVYLQYGKEPSLIKLSKNIITSQEKEIIWLKEWLAKQ